MGRPGEVRTCVDPTASFGSFRLLSRGSLKDAISRQDRATRSAEVNRAGEEDHGEEDYRSRCLVSGCVSATAPHEECRRWRLALTAWTFLHVASMFVAVSIFIGQGLLSGAVGRSGDVRALRRVLAMEDRFAPVGGGILDEELPKVRACASR